MKTRYLNTIFTNHAHNRLYNRGITQSDAWYTFQHPDGSLPGKIPGSSKFYKDYGEQRIEVVAKQNEKGEWLILSCLSKLRGDGRPLFPQKEPWLARIIKKGLEKIENLVQKRKKESSKPS
ncbi:MAG: hypothetical protein MUP45_00750 [Candidatus Marinimicrobia bacterium]|nr:hypothetical protein [Candidatus Neomarinimicrobiota bacterium]